MATVGGFKGVKSSPSLEWFAGNRLESYIGSLPDQKQTGIHRQTFQPLVAI
jgi:hypothetical protein